VIITQQAPPLVVSLLTDHPTIEARAFRGLLFAVLVAIPFWLVVAALAAWMLL
jgi:hypothetical protein